MRCGACRQVVRQPHLAQALGVAARRRRLERQRQLLRRGGRRRQHQQRRRGAATGFEVQERHGLAELAVQQLLALVGSQRFEPRLEHGLSLCRQQVEHRRRALDAAQQREQPLFGGLGGGRRRRDLGQRRRFRERGAAGATADQRREHASPKQATHCLRNGVQFSRGTLLIESLTLQLD